MSQRAHSRGGSLREIPDMLDVFGVLFEHPVLALVMLLVVAWICLPVLITRGTEVVK